MWSFPTSENKCEKGTTNNLGTAVQTAGGTNSIMIKSPYKTYCAVCTGWDAGSGKKYWKVQVNTTNYKDIKVSSIVNACKGMNGPRDWKIQYAIDCCSSWNDLPGGAFKADTGWTKGKLTNLPLPTECNNQPGLLIRWIMTSDTAADGQILTAGMMSKIDDILFTATNNTGINNFSRENINLSIYPNPASDLLTIESEKTFKSLEIINMEGQQVYSKCSVTNFSEINLLNLPKGQYFIRLNYNDGVVTKKVIVK
jgi:hypothetical protein